MAKLQSLRPERLLDADPARSPTLAARFYTAPEIFAAEREAIFFRGWHMAGHVSDLPDPRSYITASVPDQNGFICRGEERTLHRFHHGCPHRRHDLLPGQCRAQVTP